MERPIILKAHEVRGILEGRQSQLPRICRQVNCDFWLEQKGLNEDLREEARQAIISCCPFGQVGDRLWGKETWCHSTNVNNEKDWPQRPCTEVERIDNGNLWSAAIYRADGETEWLDDDGWHTERSFWKSPVVMPRWASRILLEITAIRVERLQDISETEDLASFLKDARKRGGIGYGQTWYANPFCWVVEFKRVEKQ